MQRKYKLIRKSIIHKRQTECSKGSLIGSCVNSTSNQLPILFYRQSWLDTIKQPSVLMHFAPLWSLFDQPFSAHSSLETVVLVHSCKWVDCSYLWQLIFPYFSLCTVKVIPEISFVINTYWNNAMRYLNNLENISTIILAFKFFRTKILNL